MTKFFLWIAAWLLVGCAYDVTTLPEEEIEPMPPSRGAATPESWGQLKAFKPGQIPTFPRSAAVLTLPPLPAWRIPRVQTLIAGVDVTDNDEVQRYFLRWVMRSGTGGARTEVVFDAVGFTRIATPLEQVVLSLAVEPWAPSFPDSPAGLVNAHAYAGDGNVGELQPGPMYTLYRDVTAGAGSVEIPLPVGANRVRIVGDPDAGANGPFDPNFKLQFRNGASTVARFTGLGAAPGDPSLYTVFYSGEFIPIPGGVTAVSLLNLAVVGNNKTCFVQFGLDL